MGLVERRLAEMLGIPRQSPPETVAEYLLRQGRGLGAVNRHIPPYAAA
jgi:hypothetical protein